MEKDFINMILTETIWQQNQIWQQKEYIWQQKDWQTCVWWGLVNRLWETKPELGKQACHK